MLVRNRGCVSPTRTWPFFNEEKLVSSQPSQQARPILSFSYQYLYEVLPVVPKTLYFLTARSYKIRKFFFKYGEYLIENNVIGILYE